MEGVAGADNQLGLGLVRTISTPRGVMRAIAAMANGNGDWWIGDDGSRTVVAMEL